jgi:hypothetical protein
VAVLPGSKIQWVIERAWVVGFWDISREFAVERVSALVV